MAQKLIRASKKPKEIKILGKRDPRGPDNNITIWLDGTDRLHIRVLKAYRCYKYKETVTTAAYVEIIQT